MASCICLTSVSPAFWRGWYCTAPSTAPCPTLRFSCGILHASDHCLTCCLAWVVLQSPQCCFLSYSAVLHVHRSGLLLT